MHVIVRAITSYVTVCVNYLYRHTNSPYGGALSIKPKSLVVTDGGPFRDLRVNKRETSVQLSPTTVSAKVSNMDGE